MPTEDAEPLDSGESILRSLRQTAERLHALGDMRSDLVDSMSTWDAVTPANLLRRIELAEQVETVILNALTAVAANNPLISDALGKLDARVRKLEGGSDDEGDDNFFGSPIRFDLN